MELTMGPLAAYDLGNQRSARIISAARGAHQIIGPCQTGAFYRQAILNELQQQKLDVQNLFPVDVWQSGELAELFFPDLFVEWQVIVNIKVHRQAISIEELDDLHACLSAADAPMGVLLNFGKTRLEYER